MARDAEFNADLENAVDLFEGVAIKGEGGEPTILNMNPETMQEFNKFSELLLEQIKKSEVCALNYPV